MASRGSAEERLVGNLMRVLRRQISKIGGRSVGWEKKVGEVEGKKTATPVII